MVSGFTGLAAGAACAKWLIVFLFCKEKLINVVNYFTDDSKSDDCYDKVLPHIKNMNKLRIINQKNIVLLLYNRFCPHNVFL
jgi:hypothetical protein